MRIVFMGTPDFSVAPLKALIEGGHEILAVVTQPDKPRGRGKAVQMTPVKEEALSRGIPVYQPVKVRDPEFIQVIKDLAPDVIVVVAFGQIIPQAILELFTGQTQINDGGDVPEMFHGLFPENRAAAGGNH